MPVFRGKSDKTRLRVVRLYLFSEGKVIKHGFGSSGFNLFSEGKVIKHGFGSSGFIHGFGSSDFYLKLKL